MMTDDDVCCVYYETKNQDKTQVFLNYVRSCIFRNKTYLFLHLSDVEFRDIIYVVIVMPMVSHYFVVTVLS